MNYAINHDVVVQGIEIGGSLGWGMVGAFGTGAILFFSREYAHHAVSRSYLSDDGKRIGFQVYTVLGYPGRKYEVPIGNARLMRTQSLFFSSVTPVSVEGMGKNLLLDPRGAFYEDGKLLQLLSMTKEDTLVTKEQRVAAIKDEFRRKNKRTKTGK